MARARDAAGFGTLIRGTTVRLEGFNHPFRTELTNELHARPFQPVSLPGQVLNIAFKPASGAAERDTLRDHVHLADFLSRHGAAPPGPDAGHHTAAIGDLRLKWERHTEFVSYTLFGSESARGPFSGDLAEMLPADWIAGAPGAVAAAVQCEIRQASDRDSALEMLFGDIGRGFDSGSRAGSFILDGNALAASDFRMHGEGYTRFVIIAFGDAGPRRLGRACQRLIDIEVYRALAMLALPIAQRTARRLNEVERELTALMEQVTAPDQTDSEADDLRTLTNLSAEIESLAAASAFRFGAARAYASIVEERIEDASGSARARTAEVPRVLRSPLPSRNPNGSGGGGTPQVAVREGGADSRIDANTSECLTRVAKPRSPGVDESPGRNAASAPADGGGIVGRCHQLLRGQSGDLHSCTDRGAFRFRKDSRDRRSHRAGYRRCMVARETGTRADLVRKAGAGPLRPCRAGNRLRSRMAEFSLPATLRPHRSCRGPWHRRSGLNPAGAFGMRLTLLGPATARRFERSEVWRNTSTERWKSAIRGNCLPGSSNSLSGSAF